MRFAITAAMGLTAVAFTAMAGVVDRVAVVIGNNVITESEVLREVRLTELMNGQPLDLGPAARRAAADRLVDQQLIRTEMEIGNYPAPTAAEGDAMLRKWRQEHHAALENYGVTEDELKQYLLWQLAAIRFTDQRFHVATLDTSSQSADRADASTVDDQLDAWLKQQRSSTRVQFKDGAFK